MSLPAYEIYWTFKELVTSVLHKLSIKGREVLYDLSYKPSVCLILKPFKEASDIREQIMTPQSLFSQ